MILHTVNKSPASSTALRECLSVYRDGDAVILIEDGVYAAAKNHAPTDRATDADPLALTELQLYALRSDIEARGLINRLNPDIKLVDDLGFVELATTHSKVVSWY